MNIPGAACFILALAALSGAAPPVQAAGLPTIGGHEPRLYRTVKPPRRGSGRIVLPTISEEDPAAGGASLPGFVDRPRGGAGAARWFWSAADPARGAADPGRMARLLDDLSDQFGRLAGPGAARDAARRVMADHGPALRQAAREEGLSPALLLAVIAVESGGRPTAVSPKGAQGLMQLMPATAARFGVTDALSPAQNIAGGAKYLNWLLERFDEDALLALAAYNAGEGAVDRHDGAPPYAETRAYVPKVLAWFGALRPLCAAPPEGPRAACELGPFAPGDSSPAPVSPDG
ncbi:lytic transglycosylase domain-containing protein [Rhodovulum sp. DZ06]|uniref:lytic transglycosylase domain-containing protein n=1 Tax=Rhodovulum sp. DZ06 TaxID=3425126 RepID=UPI003D3316DB